MPIDYTKSKIYKIVCNETGETYYGSTTQPLAKRLAVHKNKSNLCKSKQIIERGNYDIVLCEECPCENKEQLHAIERKWIEGNECINKNIPCRTGKELYHTNKEEYHRIQKEYRDTHKEEISLAHKKLYQANTEKMIDKAKTYYQLHKEERKQYAKEYYKTKKTK